MAPKKSLNKAGKLRKIAADASIDNKVSKQLGVPYKIKEDRFNIKNQDSKNTHLANIQKNRIAEISELKNKFKGKNRGSELGEYEAICNIEGSELLEESNLSDLHEMLGLSDSKYTNARYTFQLPELTYKTSDKSIHIEARYDNKEKKHTFHFERLAVEIAALNRDIKKPHSRQEQQEQQEKLEKKRVLDKLHIGKSTKSTFIEEKFDQSQNNITTLLAESQKSLANDFAAFCKSAEQHLFKNNKIFSNSVQSFENMKAGFLRKLENSSVNIDIDDTELKGLEKGAKNVLISILSFKDSVVEMNWKEIEKNLPKNTLIKNLYQQLSKQKNITSVAKQEIFEINLSIIVSRAEAYLDKWSKIALGETDLDTEKRLKVIAGNDVDGIIASDIALRTRDAKLDASECLQGIATQEKNQINKRDLQLPERRPAVHLFKSKILTPKQQEYLLDGKTLSVEQRDLVVEIERSILDIHNEDYSKKAKPLAYLDTGEGKSFIAEIIQRYNDIINYERTIAAQNKKITNLEDGYDKRMKHVPQDVSNEIARMCKERELFNETFADSEKAEHMDKIAIQHSLNKRKFAVETINLANQEDLKKMVNEHRSSENGKASRSSGKLFIIDESLFINKENKLFINQISRFGKVVVLGASENTLKLQSSVARAHAKFHDVKSELDNLREQLNIMGDEKNNSDSAARETVCEMISQKIREIENSGDLEYRQKKLELAKKNSDLSASRTEVAQARVKKTQFHFSDDLSKGLLSKVNPSQNRVNSAKKSSDTKTESNPDFLAQFISSRFQENPRSLRHQNTISGLSINAKYGIAENQAGFMVAGVDLRADYKFRSDGLPLFDSNKKPKINESKSDFQASGSEVKYAKLKAAMSSIMNSCSDTGLLVVNFIENGQHMCYTLSREEDQKAAQPKKSSKQNAASILKPRIFFAESEGFKEFLNNKNKLSSQAHKAIMIYAGDREQFVVGGDLYNLSKLQEGSASADRDADVQNDVIMRVGTTEYDLKQRSGRNRATNIDGQQTNIKRNLIVDPFILNQDLLRIKLKKKNQEILHQYEKIQGDHDSKSELEELRENYKNNNLLIEKIEKGNLEELPHIDDLKEKHHLEEGKDFAMVNDKLSISIGDSPSNFAEIEAGSEEAKVNKEKFILAVAENTQIFNIELMRAKYEGLMSSLVTWQNEAEQDKKEINRFAKLKLAAEEWKNALDLLEPRVKLALRTEDLESEEYSVTDFSIKEYDDPEIRKLLKNQRDAKLYNLYRDLALGKLDEISFQTELDKCYARSESDLNIFKNSLVEAKKEAKKDCVDRNTNANAESLKKDVIPNRREVIERDNGAYSSNGSPRRLDALTVKAQKQRGNPQPPKHSPPNKLAPVYTTPSRKPKEQSYDFQALHPSKANGERHLSDRLSHDDINKKLFSEDFLSKGEQRQLKRKTQAPLKQEGLVPNLQQLARNEITDSFRSAKALLESHISSFKGSLEESLKKSSKDPFEVSKLTTLLENLSSFQKDLETSLNSSFNQWNENHITDEEFMHDIMHCNSTAEFINFLNHDFKSHNPLIGDSIFRLDQFVSFHGKHQALDYTEEGYLNELQGCFNNYRFPEEDRNQAVVEELTKEITNLAQEGRKSEDDLKATRTNLEILQRRNGNFQTFISTYAKRLDAIEAKKEYDEIKQLEETRENLEAHLKQTEQYNEEAKDEFSGASSAQKLVQALVTAHEDEEIQEPLSPNDAYNLLGRLDINKSVVQAAKKKISLIRGDISASKLRKETLDIEAREALFRFKMLEEETDLKEEDRITLVAKVMSFSEDLTAVDLEIEAVKKEFSQYLQKKAILAKDIAASDREIELTRARQIEQFEKQGKKDAEIKDLKRTEKEQKNTLKNLNEELEEFTHQNKEYKATLDQEKQDAGRRKMLAGKILRDEKAKEESVLDKTVEKKMLEEENHKRSLLIEKMNGDLEKAKKINREQQVAIDNYKEENRIVSEDFRDEGLVFDFASQLSRTKSEEDLIYSLETKLREMQDRVNKNDDLIEDAQKTLEVRKTEKAAKDQATKKYQEVKEKLEQELSSNKALLDETGAKLQTLNSKVAEYNEKNEAARNLDDHSNLQDYKVQIEEEEGVIKRLEEESEEAKQKLIASQDLIQRKQEDIDLLDQELKGYNKIAHENLKSYREQLIELKLKTLTLESKKAVLGEGDKSVNDRLTDEEEKLINNTQPIEGETKEESLNRIAQAISESSKAVGVIIEQISTLPGKNNDQESVLADNSNDEGSVATDNDSMTTLDSHLDHHQKDNLTSIKDQIQLQKVTSGVKVDNLNMEIQSLTAQLEQLNEKEEQDNIKSQISKKNAELDEIKAQDLELLEIEGEYNNYQQELSQKESEREALTDELKLQKQIVSVENESFKAELISLSATLATLKAKEDPKLKSKAQQIKDNIANMGTLIEESEEELERLNKLEITDAILNDFKADSRERSNELKASVENLTSTLAKVLEKKNPIKEDKIKEDKKDNNQRSKPSSHKNREDKQSKVAVPVKPYSLISKDTQVISKEVTDLWRRKNRGNPIAPLKGSDFPEEKIRDSRDSRPVVTPDDLSLKYERPKLGSKKHGGVSHDDRFYNLKLSGVCLYEPNTEDKILGNAAIYNAELENCSLKNIDFSKCDAFSTIKFKNCRYDNCKFPDNILIHKVSGLNEGAINIPSLTHNSNHIGSQNSASGRA